MLRKGEVFGWAALLDNQPRRIARARCLEHSRLLRIDGRQTLAGCWRAIRPRATW